MNIPAWFDRLAGDIRKTLEAEMMRWGGSYPGSPATDLHSPGSDPASLRGNWADLINEYRFAGNSESARVSLARIILKTNARWSRLLNDIPPPEVRDDRPAKPVA